MPLAVNFDHFRWLDRHQDLDVERVGTDPAGAVAGDRRRGGAVWLTPRLVSEVRRRPRAHPGACACTMISSVLAARSTINRPPPSNASVRPGL
jgi:hypothetical protein